MLKPVFLTFVFAALCLQLSLCDKKEETKISEKVESTVKEAITDLSSKVIGDIFGRYGCYDRWCGGCNYGCYKPWWGGYKPWWGGYKPWWGGCKRCCCGGCYGGCCGGCYGKCYPSYGCGGCCGCGCYPRCYGPYFKCPCCRPYNPWYKSCCKSYPRWNCNSCCGPCPNYCRYHGPYCCKHYGCPRPYYYPPSRYCGPSYGLPHYDYPSPYSYASPNSYAPSSSYPSPCSSPSPYSYQGPSYEPLPPPPTPMRRPCKDDVVTQVIVYPTAVESPCCQESSIYSVPEAIASPISRCYSHSCPKSCSKRIALSKNKYYY